MHFLTQYTNAMPWKDEGERKNETKMNFTSIVPQPSATLQPDNRNGFLEFLWTWKNSYHKIRVKWAYILMLKEKSKGLQSCSLQSCLIHQLQESDHWSKFHQQVPRDIWNFNQLSIKNGSKLYHKRENIGNYLVTNVEGRNITNNNIKYWNLNSSTTPCNLNIYLER